ncbi:MAG: OmpA family protein [Hahellaceae bacterium]|nr:OmpA family protein [Hahellaceae bacterium]MCP5210260.1 OmpA family protein [Hahellaceae bacterium]
MTNVYRLFEKVFLMVRSGSILVAIMLVGCTAWPDQKGGGKAETFAGSDYYLDAVEADQRVAILKQQVEFLDAQLDVLVMQGASDCIPAAIRNLSLQSQRVRREIVAELNRDAANDLVIYQHSLREVKAKFWYVAARTHCHQTMITQGKTPFERQYYASNQPVEATAASPVVSGKQLLAMTIHFDTSRAEIAEGYLHQLNWLARHLSQEIAEITIIGYADSRGEADVNGELSALRANNVAQLLHSLGIQPEWMTVMSEGEFKPVLREQNVVAHALNRRVDILISSSQARNEVIAEAPEADVAPVTVKQWERLLAPPGAPTMVAD